jgi:hypothetical protein
MDLEPRPPDASELHRLRNWACFYTSERLHRVDCAKKIITLRMLQRDGSRD